MKSATDINSICFVDLSEKYGSSITHNKRFEPAVQWVLVAIYE